MNGWTNWFRVGLVLSMLGAGACRQSQVPPQGTPVVVGQHVVITDSDLVWYGVPFQALSPDQQKQVVEEWKNQVALYEEALSRGYLDRPDIRRRLKLVEISAVGSWLLEDLGEAVAPSPEAFARFLEQYGDLFRVRATVLAVYYEDSTLTGRIRQILNRRWALSGIGDALDRVPGVQYAAAEDVVLGEWVVSHLPESLWSRVAVPSRSLEVQGPIRLNSFWMFIRITGATHSESYLIPEERIRAFFMEHERMKRREALLRELRARHLNENPRP